MSRRLLRRSHSIISVTKQGEMHQLCRNAKDILENWSKKFSVWVHLTFQHSCAGLGSVSQRLGPVLREVMGMGMPDLLQGSLLSDGPAGGKSVCLSQWRTEGCWKGGALTHYDTIPPPPPKHTNTRTHNADPPQDLNSSRSAPGATAVCGVERGLCAKNLQASTGLYSSLEENETLLEYACLTACLSG